ncbi:hypothetical protein [Paenibacillus sinopodophylli]|uniref:hypothetical protein n=1 Tax=Paenibacillus sinopodophylli TaxID=1837342 RepID=UPI0014865BBC|nr:hypothetical protein [Paenibacillus sinopodophylli]
MVQRVGFESGTGEPKRKAPFTAKHKITNTMDEAQRAGSERWNLFIDILNENGLMEGKK